MAIAPFPWATLPRHRRSDVGVHGALHARFPEASSASIARALEDLLRRRVSVTVTRTRVDDASALDWSSFSGHFVLHTRGVRVDVAVEAEAALATISALVGEKVAPRIAATRHLDDALNGATAAVLQHLARGVGLIDAHVVAGAPPRSRIVALEVAIDVAATRSRVVVAIALPLPSPPRFNGPILRIGLENVPISLCSVVARGTVDPLALASLRAGDRLVFDEHRYERALAARVLAPADLDEGLEAQAQPSSNRLEMKGTRVSLASDTSTFDKPRRMSANQATVDGDTAAVVDTLDLLASVPVNVRAEIGAVTMTGRAWAALRAGDVVVLDTLVGDTVTLRANGAIVAHGELVDVDGAVGVRIVERTAR